MHPRDLRDFMQARFPDWKCGACPSAKYGQLGAWTVFGQGTGKQWQVDFDPEGMDEVLALKMVQEIQDGLLEHAGHKEAANLEQAAQRAQQSNG